MGGPERCQFARAYAARRLAQLRDGASLFALRAASSGKGCSQNHAETPHKNRHSQRSGQKSTRKSLILVVREGLEPSTSAL
jgi:hypothetical protein